MTRPQGLISAVFLRDENMGKGFFDRKLLLILLSIHRNYRYNAAAAAGGTEVSAQAVRRAAIGKYKVITGESSEIFVVTAAVCYALRILGRAENASVARRPPCVNLWPCARLQESRRS